MHGFPPEFEKLFNRTSSFDFDVDLNVIIIIESLKAGENKTGLELFKLLLENQEKIPNKTQYIRVTNAVEFFSVLNKINSWEHCRPILHIESHGGVQPKKGGETDAWITLASEEILTTDVLWPYFTKINIHSGFNLVLNFAACHGYKMDQVLIDAFLKRECAPFAILSGPIEEIRPSDLIDEYLNFFSIVLTNGKFAKFKKNSKIICNSSPEMFKILMVWMISNLLGNKDYGPFSESLFERMRKENIIFDLSLFSEVRDVYSFDGTARLCDDVFNEYFAVDKIPGNIERFERLKFISLAKEIYALPNLLKKSELEATEFLRSSKLTGGNSDV